MPPHARAAGTLSWLARSVAAFLAAAALTFGPALPVAADDAEAPAGEAAAPTLTLDTRAAEQQILNLVNLLRLEHGLQPVVWDEVAADLARYRCQDMIDRRYFGHDIPGVGYAPIWELQQLKGARGTGENLGLSISPNDVFMNDLFNAWIESPTHLQNMLYPGFNRLGIGVVEIPGPVDGVTYKVVTQIFAIASGPLSRA